MSGWLSPLSLTAALVTVVFLVVALWRPHRAILLYAVIGATPPFLQMGAFAGRNVSQGLLLAETCATVLAFVWLVRLGFTRVLRTAFDLPLFAFAAAGIASLLAAQLVPDPTIVGVASVTVSVGQILLILWPIGVYLAARDLLATTAQLRWIQNAVLVLAVFQYVIPFMPDDTGEYMAWARTLGLFASPFAVARLLSGGASFRPVLVALAVTPLVEGVVTGKAFLYGFVLVSTAAIMWLRASRAAVIGVAVAGCLLVAAVFGGGEKLLVGPLATLVEAEREQASLGGRTGRGQIALDTLSIWRDAPILGTGPGNSYLFLVRMRQIGTPHNQYLNILVEFGVIGLALWLWFLWTAAATGLRVYRATRIPEHRTFLLGWIGAFAGLTATGMLGDYMIHSIRNSGLELFSGYYLQWVLLGGLVSVARLEQRARVAASKGAPARVLELRQPSRRTPRRRLAAPQRAPARRFARAPW